MTKLTVELPSPANDMVQAGVRIGTGSVISSGAVVTGDVPPFSLVAGNPGRRIGVVSAPPAAPVPAEQR